MKILRLLIALVLLLGCLAWAIFWLLIGLLAMIVSVGIGFLWGLALWYVGFMPLGWWLGHRLVRKIYLRSRDHWRPGRANPETVELIVWG